MTISAAIIVVVSVPIAFVIPVISSTVGLAMFVFLLAADAANEGEQTDANEKCDLLHNSILLD